MPSAPQRRHAAGAEQHVLRQPGRRVGLVEPRGDPPLHRVVAGDVGVEQVQRHAADVDPPDVGADGVAVDRDLDADRAAVGLGHPGRRQPLRVAVDPVLVLPAAGVDPLAEVALAVHQPDGDHRHRAVGGLLEDVAGQGAETAGVDRQRDVHAELGAQEGDRTLRDRCPAAGGRARSSRDRGGELVGAGDQRRRRRRPGASARVDASSSSRTGFCWQSSKRSRSIAANSSRAPGSHDQR